MWGQQERLVAEGQRASGGRVQQAPARDKGGGYRSDRAAWGGEEGTAEAERRVGGCENQQGLEERRAGSCERALPVLLALLLPFSKLLGLWLRIFLVLQRKGENQLLR